MKIIRFVARGDGAMEAVVCSDTARANRGEVYFISQADKHVVMPCIYFRIRQNTRTLGNGGWFHLVDGYGYALHLENESCRAAGRETARIYSADRTIIASPLARMEEALVEEEVAKLPARLIRIVVEDNVVTCQPPSVAFVAQCMHNLRNWLTLNAGDWVVFPLSETPQLLCLPTRVYLYESERLVLDELLRS